MKVNNKFKNCKPMCPIFPFKSLSNPKYVPYNNEFCDFTIKMNKLRTSEFIKQKKKSKNFKRYTIFIAEQS